MIFMVAILLVVLCLLKMAKQQMHNLHPDVLPHWMMIRVSMILLVVVDHLLLIQLMITYWLMFLLIE